MMRLGFEVNTDIALIDPDWEAFASLHDHRYGLAIDYLKSVVKGASYANQVMDFVAGPQGFYVQSKQFPAAFYGDTGKAEVCEVVEAEAQAAVWEATALYRTAEARSLTCIYSDHSPAQVFFGYRLDGSQRYELAELRTGLPLHLRVMVDAPQPTSLLGKRCGTFIYQRLPAGRHLLLKAPGRRKPFPLLDGFDE
jgi:hypothetical protein